jgi:hypothetical protein
MKQVVTNDRVANASAMNTLVTDDGAARPPDPRLHSRALAGAWLGPRIFKRLSDRQFEFAVNLLLALPGVSLAF